MTVDRETIEASTPQVRGLVRSPCAPESGGGGTSDDSQCERAPYGRNLSDFPSERSGMPTTDLPLRSIINVSNNAFTDSTQGSIWMLVSGPMRSWCSVLAHENVRIGEACGESWEKSVDILGQKASADVIEVSHDGSLLMNEGE